MFLWNCKQYWQSSSKYNGPISKTNIRVPSISSSPTHKQKQWWKLWKSPTSRVENRWTYTFLMPRIQHTTKKKTWWKLCKSLSARAQKRLTHQGSVQFGEPIHIHLNYASYPEESLKYLVEAMKIPSSTVGKRWPQQEVVQFREPTSLYLPYASNPVYNKKNLMEAL